MKAPLRIEFLLIAALCCAAALPAYAAGVDDLLEKERWSESTYGVSLRMPKDSRFQARNDDKVILRMAPPDNAYRISVEVKKTAGDNPLNLPGIVEEDMRQLALQHPAARLIGQAGQKFRVPGFEGAKSYFHVPRTKIGPINMGHAFILLDSRTVLMLELAVTGKPEALEKVMPIFEAVLKELKITPPEVMIAQREVELARGQRIERAMTTDVLRKVMVPMQWYRWTEGDQDVGYSVIAQSDFTTLGMKGIRLDVQARIYSKATQQVYDVMGNFFLSDDKDYEIWSVRTTSRTIGAQDVGVMGFRVTPNQKARLEAFLKQEEKKHKSMLEGNDDGADPMAGKTLPQDMLPDLFFKNNFERQQQVVSWAETGVRSGDLIKVEIEKPEGVVTREWDRRWNANRGANLMKLKKKDEQEKELSGYLSQVQVHMMGPLLAKQDKETLGFYAYYPNAGEVSYRTVRVEQLRGGGHRVLVNPTPEQPVEITDYDAKGNFVRRQLNESTIIEPTTTSELSRIWR